MLWPPGASAFLHTSNSSRLRAAILFCFFLSFASPAWYGPSFLLHFCLSLSSPLVLHPPSPFAPGIDFDDPYPAAMAEIKIDFKLFHERISHFVSTWKSDKRGGANNVFHDVSSIVILMGKMEDVQEYHKNNCMHVSLPRDTRPSRIRKVMETTSKNMMANLVSCMNASTGCWVMSSPLRWWCSPLRLSILLPRQRRVSHPHPLLVVQLASLTPRQPSILPHLRVAGSVSRSLCEARMPTRTKQYLRKFLAW